MNAEELRRVMVIKESAYSTHGPFTLEDWFAARRIVLISKQAISRASQLNKLVPTVRTR